MERVAPPSGLLLVMVPLFQAIGYGSVMTSLRRGRCFEELMGTGVHPLAIADGIAVHGMQRAAQAGLPVWILFFLMGALFDKGSLLVLPLALLWLPTLIFLAAFDSYAILALSALGGGRGRGVPFQVVAGAVILAPLGLLGLWTWRLTDTSTAGLSTTSAVVDERESGTLAFVALTRLTPADFLDGSAQAAWIPLAVETSFALPLLAAMGYQTDVPLSVGLLGLLLLYACPWMACYLGLSASAASFQRGAARMHTLSWLAVLAVAGMGLNLPSMVLFGGQNGLALGMILTLLASGFAAFAFRLVALRDLSNEGLEALGLPAWLVRLYSNAS